jgi:2,4-dienoyl-CoA reductase-like NADH-dependent reductase (Old Yellow Enzyme family)
MPGLFEPVEIRGVRLRNRLGVSPMCMYSSVDGRANDWHVVHLGSRAVGGFGLVMVEATAVEARGRISPDDAGLWEHGQIESWARVAAFVKSRGAAAGMQLAHAGRKASVARPWGHPRAGQALSDREGGWPVVGPSAVAFAEGYRVPEALTEAGIREVIASFVLAAERALAAGFEVVELHGAHGYLAHSFLSPLSNKRTDTYGGTFENRIRFVMELAAAVRKVWPERLPLFVRLSCTDWVQGGWTLEESVELARRLKKEGVDLIDCSSGGGVAGAKIAVGPGYQVPFAEAIRKGSGIMTAAVGMITSAQQAEEIVSAGKADLVLLGREALRTPYFAANAAKELGVKGFEGWPGQYGRA